MPEYRFKCQKCGKVKDYFFKTINNKQEIICKECGGIQKKQINFAGGFDLRGPGFYKNDYKGK